MAELVLIENHIHFHGWFSLLMFWKHMYVYFFGGLEILEGRKEDP